MNAQEIKAWNEEKSGFKYGERVSLLGQDRIVTDIVSYGCEWYLHLDGNCVAIPISTTGLEHKPVVDLGDGRKIVEYGDGWYIVEWPNGQRMKRFHLPGPKPVEKTKTEEINFWADRGGRM